LAIVTLVNNARVDQPECVEPAGPEMIQRREDQSEPAD